MSEHKQEKSGKNHGSDRSRHNFHMGKMKVLIVVHEKKSSTQSKFNVGTASKMVDQHCTDIGFDVRTLPFV